jgi:predicted transcriptional regulator
MQRKVKAQGGGRLGRSETVTVRLDPKLNYLTEIAARAHRRTKSSLIEAALARFLDDVRVEARPGASNKATVAAMAEQLWHVDEPERLKRLVAEAPHLLTFEEQKIWAVITKNRYFWLGKWSELNPTTEYYCVDTDPKNLWIEQVERSWDLIKRVANDEADYEELPSRPTTRPKETIAAPPALVGKAAGT